MIHDVAVIGAGVSGLAAARRLMKEGRNVVVVEKSRGLGGRAATRRFSLGSDMEVPVDHGAQFFTARDIRFVEQVSRWQEEGICFPWCESFMTWKAGALHDSSPQWREPRYACREGMSQLGRSLAEGVEVIREYEVSSVSLVHDLKDSEGTKDEQNKQGSQALLEPDALGSSHGYWQLQAAPLLKMPPVRARALIVSAPLPQAVGLVGGYLAEEQHELIGRIHYGACIAVMARYSDSTPTPPWRGIQVRDPEGKISWMAWDFSKRVKSKRANLETEPTAAIAVIQGAKGFSSRWLDASKEELRRAGEELLREASVIGGSWMGEPLEYIVHRWRYAHPEGPNLPEGFLRAASEEPLYVIGDGLNGGRIEGAWLSGVFAAEDLLLRGRGK